MAGIPDKTGLRMVWVNLQIGKQKGFAAGLVAAAAGFDGHEYCVNLCQGLRVVKLQDPAFPRGVVFIEDA